MRLPHYLVHEDMRVAKGLTYIYLAINQSFKVFSDDDTCKHRFSNHDDTPST